MTEPNFDLQFEKLRQRGIGAVKPMPRLEVRAAILFLVMAVAALALGFGAGGKGWRALETMQRLSLAVPMAAAALWIAWDLAARMAPGSRIRVPALLPALAALAVIALWPFAAAPLHATKLFYPACLAFTSAGSALGGFSAARFLRRGFCAAPGTTLLLAAAAGLAGFAAVEIFCPIVEGWHIVTSHVLPAALAGAVAGRYLRLNA